LFLKIDSIAPGIVALTAIPTPPLPLKNEIVNALAQV
jgi:hypothetical protein